jgi:hypothetical protein
MIVTKKKKQKRSRYGLYLHYCPACDNKWTARFEVKRCFSCGLDEKAANSSTTTCIQRKFVPTVKCSDGKFRMKLYRAKSNGE